MKKREHRNTVLDTTKVSILLPVHNGAPFLEHALSSILSQTLKNLELIAVDDGSSDESSEILKRFADKDRRIRILTQSNQGIVAALNNGLELANGEYVARMDADDVCLPDRLRRQAKFLDQNRQVGVVGGSIRYIDSYRVARYPTHNDAIRCRLLFHSAFAHPATMARRSVLNAESPLYQSDYKHAEDYDLWERLSHRTEMANLEEVVLEYRLHDQQVTQSNLKTMIANGNRVRLRQLERFGQPFSSDELTLHERISTINPVISRDFIRSAHDWLAQLNEINQQKGLYPIQEFQKTLASYWFETCNACTALGGWIRHEHNASELSKSLNVDRLKRSKFFAKSLLCR